MATRFPALLVAIPFTVGIAVAGGRGCDGLRARAERGGLAPAIAAGALALVPVASANRPVAVVVAFALGGLRSLAGAPPPLASTEAYAADSVWLGRVVAVRPAGFRLASIRPRVPGLVDVFAPGDAPARGSRVIVRGALEPIEPRRNPGLPDPRQLARRDGVVARLRAGEPARVVAPPRRSAALGARVARWRARFAARQDALYPPDAAAFLRALFLGDRTLLAADLRADFRDTGAAHLLALSGQHTVLIAILIAKALTLLRIPRRLHLSTSLLALGAYLLLVGAPSSVARAGVVLALFLLASPLRRRSEPGNTLGVALLVLLALNPAGLWDAGLTLSFGATAGLVFLLPIVRERIFPGAGGAARHLAEGVRVTVAATWPLVPLEGAYFGAIPVVGVATNLVLVPLTGLLLSLHVAVLAFAAIPFVACGLPSPAPDLAAAATLLTRATVAFVHLCARALPPPVTLPAAWIPFASLFAVVSALLLWPPRAFPHAGLIAAPLVAIVLAAAPGRPPLRVTLFDVGQGDAILVEGRAARFLVDAGPAWSRWDSGERVVVPALRARGIRSLDALVLSHGDADHSGGGAAVLAGLRVGALLEPDPDAVPRSRIHARTREAALRSGARRGALAEGDAIRLDGRAPADGGAQPGATHRASHDPSRAAPNPPTVARVLHPERGALSAGAAPSGNERSIQLDVACGLVHVLLTGDLPAEEESRLVERGLLPRGAILKVAHHGSRGSTGVPYLDALRPPAALISVGERNRYHHPHPLLLARLTAAQACVYRTDEGGALVVETDGVHAVVRGTLAMRPALRLVYLAPGDPRPAGPLPRAPVSAEPPASD